MTANPPPPNPEREIVLDYAHSRVESVRRIRGFIFWLALFLIFVGLVLNPLIGISERLGYGILGTPLGPIEDNSWDNLSNYALHAAGFLGLFLVTQWMRSFNREGGSSSGLLTGPAPPDWRSGARHLFIGNAHYRRAGSFNFGTGARLE